MSFPFPYTGPIAPETNPRIEPQWFQPSLFPISAISYGASTTVTTGTTFGVSNNYVVGQVVRFNIPKAYGAQKLNGQQGNVISIPGSNQVVVDIDSRQDFDPFIPSPTYGPTPPQIAAIGDVNSGPTNSQVVHVPGANNQTIEQTTYVSGSFQNISPF